MVSDRVLRRACGLSVAYNLLGAASLAAPAQLAAPWGLPVPDTSFYSTQLALAVLLFGGVYAWLTRASPIPRAVVDICAIGKLQFFALFVGYWAAGQLPGLAVLSASGDLLLGLIFTEWLWTTRPALGR